MSPAEVDQSKRNFMIKTAYVAPIVATVSVLPRFASAGSTNAKIHCDNGVGTGPDCLPNGWRRTARRSWTTMTARQPVCRAVR